MTPQFIFRVISLCVCKLDANQNILLFSNTYWRSDGILVKNFDVFWEVWKE